jgi:hypothetical protein
LNGPLKPSNKSYHWLSKDVKRKTYKDFTDNLLSR